MDHIADALKRRTQNKPMASSDTPSPNEEREWLCPVCGGTGYLRLDVPVDHPDFGKLVPCDCRLVEREEQKMEELRAISNLKTMARFIFDTFKPEGHALNAMQQSSLHMAYEAARAFARQPEGWLVLQGGYGCGKTHLAAAIANEVIRRGQAAIFVVVPDLLDHLRAAYSPYSSTTYDQRFEEIRATPLLILDDLGAHSSTPWAQEKLYQLFNYRYNAQLPTVITTNVDMDQIDIRIRSRLSDGNLARICKILAADFRSGMPQESSELSSLALHSNQTLSNFDLRPELGRKINENLRRALKFARDYAANPQDWVAFSGTYGCGKTHLAAAIANERVRMGQPALFVVVPDLLDHLRASYNPNSLTPYDKRFDEVRKAPLLVLDDLGTESATPWAEEKLYQLFNHRYNARLPTVITMAQDVELKPRLKSLILDVGRCATFDITAPSYRNQPGRNTRRWDRK